MGDIFGRKSCVIFAFTVFALGSLFCRLARNMNELIAARERNSMEVVWQRKSCATVIYYVEC